MGKGLVISVGAGVNQKKFIEKLKELGYSVAAFGKGKNDAHVIELCDFFAEIDTADYTSAIRWIESLDVEPMGAGSYAGGVAILTLQHILKYFKLPGHIPDEFLVGMNKLVQQKLYERYHLSTIKTYGPNELERMEVVEGVKYIVKPFIGRGSSGVRIVTGNELKKMISCNEIGVTEMVQECVEGIEYRVLVYIQDGKIKIMAPVKRQSYEDTFLLGRLYIEKDEQERIEAYFEQFVIASGIENAVLKADIICGTNEINLIEIDIGVGGGNYFKEYISECLQLDLLECYVKMITGQTIEKRDVLIDNLLMDYVFNWTGTAISYDKETCIRELKAKVGAERLIINSLHPEEKRQVESNADFIFTVIHSTKNISVEELNQYVNERLFVKK